MAAARSELQSGGPFRVRDAALSWRKALSLRTAVVLPLVLMLGCGHSEDEWQAQLAKYAALEKKDNDLASQLGAQQSRVKELSDQLEAMGVKLSSEGSEKEKL